MPSQWTELPSGHAASLAGVDQKPSALRRAARARAIGTGKGFWLSPDQAIPGDSWSVSPVSAWKGASPAPGLSQTHVSTRKRTHTMRPRAHNHTQFTHVHNHMFTHVPSAHKLTQITCAHIATSTWMYTPANTHVHTHRHTHTPLSPQAASRMDGETPLGLICLG